MTSAGRPRLGLVVPSLAGNGGVQAVARFIRNVVVQSGQFDLQVVSLPESSRDPHSLRLTAPPSWVRGAGVAPGEWEGTPFVHVGAVASELEFRRYRPRHALTRLLADCDVVQVVCGFPAWANAVLDAGRPVSVHVATLARLERRRRDANARGLPARWRRLMTGMTDRLDDRALRRVDAIQVMNPWMLKYSKTLNAGRQVDLRYLPPGIDTRAFRPLDRERPAQAGYILCVGRLHDPRKRMDVLLDAYARLPDGVRHCANLVLAGSRPPPEAFWSHAEMLGLRNRIRYVERPTDDALLLLYQEASVFASSSDEEGFGMVLLEAMACGVPVVSTCSGGPEGIVTDGVDGYLVDRDDASALAARLTHLLEDRTLNTRMGANARETIERRYDERVAGPAFLEIWNRLAHKVG